MKKIIEYISLNLWKTLSLKKKMSLALCLLLALVGALTAKSYYTINKVNNDHLFLAENNFKKVKILDEIRNSMLTLRRHEKDYLLRLLPKYIKKHEVERNHLLALINELNTLKLPSEETSIKAINEHSKQYFKGFLKVVDNLKKEGNSKEGIRGELRSTGHKIRDHINNKDYGLSYKVDLLNFRKHEKDFLLRRDEKYYDFFKKDYKKKLSNNKLDAEYIKLLANYDKKFGEMVINYKSIKDTISGFRKSIHAVEKHTKSLIESNMENLHIEEKRISESTEYSQYLFIFLSSLVILITVTIALYIFNVSDRLTLYINNLKNTIINFNSAADKISNTSVELTTLTHEQAAGIQQTASSLTEITSMVDNNTTAVFDSKEKSERSTKEAETGKSTIQEVLNSMTTIQDSSVELSDCFGNTSKSLDEIVGIINIINEKTKVINDIAFQTKLLSFNASVEAARAGEMGKGFSVVAEEVGNLANLSGTSAEEISKIIDESISKVEEIAEINKKEVERIIHSNSNHITKGVGVADSAHSSLNIIIQNIDSINESINGIANASQEQSTGVKEISNAINEFSVSNNQTANLAKESNIRAQDVLKNAGIVTETAEALEAIILGESRDAL
jgi:methyl-accepting chemotaxis protein